MTYVVTHLWRDIRGHTRRQAPQVFDTEAEARAFAQEQCAIKARASTWNVFSVRPARERFTAAEVIAEYRTTMGEIRVVEFQ